MTWLHRKLLKKAATTDNVFNAEGADARVAWELLNAKLIEGEPILDQLGLPLKVIVMGITVTGREELSKTSRFFWGWFFSALAVAVGTVVGAIISHTLNLR